MDGTPLGDEASAPSSLESKLSGFVRLIRFTIQPDRRADLIKAARCSTSSTAGFFDRRQHALLVELDDEQWLSISITSLPPDTVDDPPFVELAEGILGDEDGAIVAVAETSAERRDRAKPWPPDGPP